MRYLKPFDLVRRYMFMLGRRISDSTQFHVTSVVIQCKPGWKHDLYRAGASEVTIMQKQFQLVDR